MRTGLGLISDSGLVSIARQENADFPEMLPQDRGQEASQGAEIAVFSPLPSRFAAETLTFRRSGWKFAVSTIILRGSIQFERRRSRCI